MSRFDRRHIVLMGVSGCGKSTIGEALSHQTGLPYVDGDDMHPAANIAKMRQGIALEDDDRAPWLAECGRSLAGMPAGMILGCSALKARYRTMIREGAAPVQPVFVYLHGSKATLQARLDGRQNHFMPASLLASQIASLEVPSPQEQAIIISMDQTVEVIVHRIMARIANRPLPVAAAP